MSSAALRELLLEILGGSRQLEPPMVQQRLNGRVERFRFASRGEPRALVVKRLASPVAARNEKVLRRWLPAAGLGRLGPNLLGTAAERSGAEVWHVYEDLGDWGLEARAAEPECVEAAVRAIAALHLQFARHPLLGECRLWGGDLGIHFYSSNVADALHALAGLSSPRAAPAAEDLRLRDRLIGRLQGLLREAARRANLIAEWGGPETLLHGDLWTKNVLVSPSPAGFEARLIDWDHAGVGPLSYDLSTFLLRFPAGERPAILERYEREVAGSGWRLPPPAIWNELFETAELARISNRLIWPAIAILEGDGRWGWEELREVERWFEALEPALSREGKEGKSGS